MTLTENSLHPKSTFQRPPNHHFMQKFNLFFLARTQTNIPPRMHQNTISSEKSNIFSGERAKSPPHTLPWERGTFSPTPFFPNPTPRPIKPSESALASLPEFKPELLHCTVPVKICPLRAMRPFVEIICLLVSYSYSCS